jgi:hypothetical protein
MSSAQSSVSDADAIAALGPKPGCWQLRLHVSAEDQLSHPAKPPEVSTLEGCKRDVLARLTPQVRAKINPDEIKYYENTYCANLAKAAKKNQEEMPALLKKGGDSDLLLGCTLEGFTQMAQDVYGALDPRRHCTRKIEEIGGHRHMHVTCDDLQADYQRMDAEHFTGTRREIRVDKDPKEGPSTHSTIVTLKTKWISEAQAHMPYSPPNTDLDGVRARGAPAVTRLDPYRIVAVIDGKKFIAGFAFDFLSNTSADEIDQFHTVPALFQNTFLRYAVACRAQKLHLDLLPPWKGQLADYGPLFLLDPDDDPLLFTRPFIPTEAQVAKYGVEPLSLATNQQIENILWDAYFAQFRTPAEKQRELQALQQKYKVTVIDPDFFELIRPN